MDAPLDQLSRPMRDLRISVTDRCNLRCGYCMPREVFGRGFEFMPHRELLRFEEVARLCRLHAGLGVNRVRLTGGEPLLRRDLDSLVAMIARLDGIEEVALTTNGTLLASKASALRSAGLGRVTVSLDALDPVVFRTMTDTEVSLERVLEGIDAAGRAGLQPVKINMVVRRGVNDHCVLPMAEHFRHRPETLRFIEFMDVGESNRWRLEEVVSAAEIRAAVEARWPLEALEPARPGEVATRYRYGDGAGEIGFIHSVSMPFCAGCTRARLSADGRLYTCLFAANGLDLRGPLRAGAGDEELASLIARAWAERSDRYSEQRAHPGSGPGAAGARASDGNGRRGKGPSKIEMSYIGG